MAKYVFGVAKLDIGGIGVEQVAAKVSELSGGVRGVKCIEISQALHVSEQTVSPLLAQASMLGLVRRIDAFRWLPGEFAADLTT